MDGKRWLSSEVLDGAFEFMSSKLKCVESLSYITMEPYATESFNSNYLKEKMSQHTNILIIPILEKHHWFSIVCYLNEKVTIYLDSMFLEIKLKYFQKMLQIISLLFSVVNIEEWALIQPDNLLPQIDGFNCGIHAILNTYYLLFPNTDKDNVASDYCYEDLAAARYWLAYKLKNLKAFEHKRKKNSDFVKDEYIKDIPTLNLKDVKTTLGDNKMFTDIKSLITERNSQMPSQRRKMLNRLKDFDDNSEDDELNLEKQNLMNFKEKEKEETQKYSIESNSSYDETIKNLESTNFGVFINSHKKRFETSNLQ